MPAFTCLHPFDNSPPPHKDNISDHRFAALTLLLESQIKPGFAEVEICESGPIPPVDNTKVMLAVAVNVKWLLLLRLSGAQSDAI